MSKVEQIVADIRALNADELADLYTSLGWGEYDAWDRQMIADSMNPNSALSRMEAEALRDSKEGRTKPL